MSMIEFTWRSQGCYKLRIYDRVYMAAMICMSMIRFTWRSHGCYELYVDEFDGRDVLEVVPVPVIEPLSQ